MALNFPTNPTLNQVYTDGNYSFVWDGNSWVSGGSIASVVGFSGNITASFIAANSSGVYANGAFIQANAAFNAANSASDTWVRNQANSAFIQANSAFIHANAAYNAANNVSADAITNGTSNVKVVTSGGNVQITIGGTTQTTISSNLVSHNEGVLENVMYRVNSPNVTSNIVISNTYNYMSVGPITINSGITVNVANGARWVIV
jgi:hypothetical protein